MSRGSRIVLGSALALTALLTLITVVLLHFDWNRAKPWISQHVSDATGRSFAIHGNLSLTWHVPDTMELGWRHWVPWPRLNASQVVFGNPRWAQNPAMAEVKEITFSLNPFALLDKTISIPLLALDSPSLWLERQSDGTSNWRFGDEDTSWKLHVHQFALNQGSVYLADAVKHADLRVDIESLEKGRRDFQLEWNVSGRFDGEAISGNGRAGAVLSLRRKRAAYPLEGNLKIGNTAISTRGALATPLSQGIVDLHVKISGTSMAQLYPVLDLALPETRPFALEGHLTSALNDKGRQWRFDGFRGRMGDSDLSGTLTYHGRMPRPLLEGSVSSAFLNFTDLAPLIGADSRESKTARGSTILQPKDKLLPIEDFQPERWNSIDADIQFTGRKIMRGKQLPVSNLVTRVRLREGELAFAPMKFNIAGGNVVTDLIMNGKTSPVTAEVKLSARHLRLKQMFPGLQETQASQSEMNGDAMLTATGNSVAALFASANGEIKAIVHQGSVSRLLLEKLGLDVSSVIATKFFGDSQVRLNCAANDFVVENGIMRARTVLIDTDEATIYVNGDIDFAQEKIALEFTPDSKGMRLFSLDAPLYVSGTFTKPKVDMEKNTLAVKTVGAVLQTALVPTAVSLLPLMHAGPGEKSECNSIVKAMAAKFTPTKPKTRTEVRNRSAARVTETTSGR
jgi:AsmA family protein